ncbi:streptophobe family protein [Streptomyces sp. NPDC058045]|uniref:streptophobe family protein n=1 Tax=Streptomyces sp. NPDC058045 TaxID=3346311 RepID=UPI0036E006A4
MTRQTTASSRSGGRRALHRWWEALLAVVAALFTMLVLASLGLTAAGAADLPQGGFGRVLAATVVTAVGGSIDVSGVAGAIAGTEAGVSVLPLSVALGGALVLGAGFLRPLRRGELAGIWELAGWVGRLAVLWLLGLLALAWAARHTFRLSLSDPELSGLGELFGIRPEVRFAADVPLTVVFGMLWLAGVLVVSLLVTGAAPLPGRWLRLRESLSPVAYAMVGVLLVCVVLGVLVALVVAATHQQPARTFAVVLLGLPNLVWLAFTLGLGGVWHGRVEGPFGLPMPEVLNQVLRTPHVSRLDLGTLAEHDGRVWWLVVIDAVLLVGAGFTAAARGRPGVPLWRHAVRLALGVAATVLAVALLGRVSAYFGLSLLGIGDLGGSLSGRVLLRPEVWSMVGLGLAWGAVCGVAGALLARWAGLRGRSGAEGLVPRQTEKPDPPADPE